MGIDKNTAQTLIADATKRVWATWGAFIPAAYKVSPDSIFVLHTDDASLRVPFRPVWNSLFKAATVSTESADQIALPGGFVTPERNRYARKIHVNLSAGEFDWTGLFAHEYIHWLSHENFYPDFYGSAPGSSSDAVEGATDYLMLKCFHGFADGLTVKALTKCAGSGNQKKRERAAYNWKGQYDRMRAWVKSAPGNESALANYVFNGTRVALPM